MVENLLDIQNLQVEVEGKKILQDLSLQIKSGEIHAVMGPNGSGKSTLCNALMGHPKYAVVSGDALLNGESLITLSPDKRAQKGLFLAFQYPKEVPGVTFGNFLRLASNNLKRANSPEFAAIGPAQYFKVAAEHMSELQMDKKFVGRSLNMGFSGGEKKRAEIVQMLALEPKIALLDEIDSGLDVDALKTVAEGIQKAYEKLGMGVLLITHYQRILNYIKPDFVHIMIDGRIVKSGDASLVLEIEKEGYAKYLTKK